MGRRRAAGVLLALALVLWPAAGCGPSPQGGALDPQAGLSGTLRIRGSDTMVNLAQAWVEAFAMQHPRGMVAVAGGGSGVGIAGLVQGVVDLALASRPLGEDEFRRAQALGVNPQAFVVGLDGVAVVVHPANPVRALALPQLGLIFSGQITNWAQVGGPDRDIVLISRVPGSGTHLSFKAAVLGERDFAPTALQLPSSHSIALAVAGTEGAVGYLGLGYVGRGVKPLALARRPGDWALLPLSEHVRSGRYPIVRPLYVYAAAPPEGLAEAFLAFAMSPEGQRLVAQAGFVPVR